VLAPDCDYFVFYADAIVVRVVARYDVSPWHIPIALLPVKALLCISKRGREREKYENEVPC
jgi:hypothetical protein